jgi:serine/threonine protein kinase
MAGSQAGMCARCLLAAALRHPVTAALAGLPQPGEWIGTYRLVRLLGEGGMGMVFLAEQARPIARQVALKVIKLGMDTHAVLARFQSEQQAIALMDHPNIASVYEAGATAEGRPFFVMEFVPGLPITDYCDQRRLNTRQRLELFLKVANAVQHAHQKGIIHRDLKPSNILVMDLDGEPVPKIIDFGLARATDKNTAEHTLFTEVGVLIGTPEYMSPEQASLGERDVDTRTDIYSLGVLLYELLVGAVPFASQALRAAGYDEIRRILREDDPPRPVTRFDSLGDGTTKVAACRATDSRSLRRELRGDLEWITLKTLEKDRSRRYATVADLAEDIQRRLAGEPVAAAPPDPIYRLRKFAGRHALQLAAASTVFLALLAGLGLSTAYYLRSEYERESGERQHYTAYLGAAEELLLQRQSAPARELLLACAPAMRNWEWRHLWSQSESGGAGLLRRVEEPIDTMAVAARGGAVALGFGTGIVEVVRPDGTVAQRWQARTGAVRGLAFSPDGTQLASVGGDPAVRVWDVSASRSITELQAPFPVSSVAYSPGGRLIAAGSTDGAAIVWEAAARSRLFTVRTGQPVDGVDFVPDGRALVTTGRELAQLWFIPSGKLRRSYRESALVAFSGDGMLAMTAAAGSTEASVSNRAGQLRGVLHTASAIVAAAFRPRSSRVVIATRAGSLEIWSTAYYEHLVTLHADPGIRQLRFTGDGRLLVGLYEKEIRTWDTKATHPPSEAPPGAEEGSTLAPSVWSIFRKMLAGGIAVLLAGGALCAALFRRRAWQAAIDKRLRGIPVTGASLRAARAGRRVARIIGALLALFFVFMALGEGMPLPSHDDIRYAITFAGFWLMGAGLILSWIWEAWGGLCALADWAR